MDIMQAFGNWCVADTAGARLTRTIVQGIVGVIVANLDVILGMYIFDPVTRGIVVPLVMAILAPIQKALGESLAEPVKGEHVKE